jgi:hypothetical protein
MKSNQPKLLINEIDVLCVTIAALFYAIGQKPFAKTFERFVDLTLQTELHNNRFDHEMITNAIINRLLINVVEKHPVEMTKLLNGLKNQHSGERPLDIWEGVDNIRTIKLYKNSQDLQFIKDLIFPPTNYKDFKIVQNKWSGLDSRFRNNCSQFSFYRNAKFTQYRSIHYNGQNCSKQHI